MPLQDTGIIKGSTNEAILVNPKSAYVIQGKCPHGCSPCYFVAGSTWVDDVDQATIFRNWEAGQIAATEARRWTLIEHCGIGLQQARHRGESQDPEDPPKRRWIPAFAGMTVLHARALAICARLNRWPRPRQVSGRRVRASLADVGPR